MILCSDSSSFGTENDRSRLAGRTAISNTLDCELALVGGHDPGFILLFSSNSMGWPKLRFQSKNFAEKLTLALQVQYRYLSPKRGDKPG